DYRYGQAMTQQEARQRPLQTAGGFQNNQTNAAVCERFKQCLKSRLIVGRAVRAAHTVQRPFERFLRHVHADEVQRCQFTSSSVCHIPSLHYAKFIQVTVRAWRQTQAPARPHALGRAASSKGERAVQALANGTKVSMTWTRNQAYKGERFSPWDGPAALTSKARRQARRGIACSRREARQSPAAIAAIRSCQRGGRSHLDATGLRRHAHRRRR